MKKRYFKRDQHLAQHFEYYGQFLSGLPTFQCSQIVKSLFPYSSSSVEMSFNKGYS